MIMSKPVAVSDEIVPDAALTTDPGECVSWRAQRDALGAQLQQRPLPEITAEEVEVHFSGMPEHYWERVNEEDVVWGLRTIHGFLKLVTTPNTPATAPFVNWRQDPGAARTRVMFCTWDRHGLLAKAAAAFSAVRLNILQADVFTRTDNVVLDLFSVSHSDGHGPATLTQLEEMRFLLEGALSEPPRFASVWACSRHKFLAPPTSFGAHISFDNESSLLATAIHVEAPDRLGLLYDILQTLADRGLRITQASIQTRNELAHDIIQVTDALGKKVAGARELELLRRSLETALT